MDRLYTVVPLSDSRGPRAQLRVVAVPWKGVYKAHIREYYPDEQGRWKAGRGTAFNLEDLDAIVYALGLMLEDYKAGKLEEKSESEQSSSESFDVQPEP